MSTCALSHTKTMCTYVHILTYTHMYVHTDIHTTGELTKVNNMAIKDRQTATENLDIKIKTTDKNVTKCSA